MYRIDPVSPVISYRALTRLRRFTTRASPKSNLKQNKPFSNSIKQTTGTHTWTYVGENAKEQRLTNHAHLYAIPKKARKNETHGMYQWKEVK